MAKPTLSSFVSSNQYQSETIATNPLVAGFYAGGTSGTRYTAPTFSGVSGAASNDPGGMFGWLVYAKSTLSPVADSDTTKTYYVYTNPGSLVSDLNLLNGITACLVSTLAQGGTYGFFLSSGTTITPKNAGTDFIHAINYLAYGGTIVLTGSTAGFDDYENQNNKSIEVLIGSTANASLVSWLNTKQYTVGVFPTKADAVNGLGAGYTMPNYDTFAGSSYVTTGTTFSSKIFNVYGTKTQPAYDLSTLSVASTLASTTITAVADVAGFFARAKSQNGLFVSVAGVNVSSVLNGKIANAVEWSNSSLKTILRNNRVNFFINYTPIFLGQDLVGATANTAAVVSSERIGASELRISIQKDVTTITLKYLYLINNPTTRSALTTEVTNYLGKYTTYIDPAYTQVICDNSNNTDNSTTITVDLIVKPILSADTILINTSLTA
jgi:hypothetical protein